MLNSSEASLRRLTNYSVGSDPDDEDEGRDQDVNAVEPIWPSARTNRRERDQQYNLVCHFAPVTVPSSQILEKVIYHIARISKS